MTLRTAAQVCLLPNRANECFDPLTHPQSLTPPAGRIGVQDFRESAARPQCGLESGLLLQSARVQQASDMPIFRKQTLDRPLAFLRFMERMLHLQSGI